MVVHNCNHWKDWAHEQQVLMVMGLAANLVAMEEQLKLGQALLQVAQFLMKQCELVLITPALESTSTCILASSFGGRHPNQYVSSRFLLGLLRLYLAPPGPRTSTGNCFTC